MSNKILRPRETWAKIGVGRSNFHANYRYKPGGDKFVPGTNIPRLKPVPLGPRAVGFFNDEAEALIEDLRRYRDGGAQ